MSYEGPEFIFQAVYRQTTSAYFYMNSKRGLLYAMDKTASTNGFEIMPWVFKVCGL